MAKAAMLVLCLSLLGVILYYLLPVIMFVAALIFILYALNKENKG
jgi:hypothetical protein